MPARAPMATPATPIATPATPLQPITKGVTHIPFHPACSLILQSVVGYALNAV